jgi:hypothetical protein
VEAAVEDVVEEAVGTEFHDDCVPPDTPSCARGTLARYGRETATTFAVIGKCLSRRFGCV